MARAIRWQFSFISFAGRTTTVSIYDEDWTGGITQLTAAATPVEFEDDDDEDLLNVVRAKTGYLNIVETSYGDLDALYPSTNTSRYVTILYGSRMIFYGYIQSQAFEQPAEPGPRVLSFPITSALGLLGDFYLNPITTPGSVTLGSLLSEIISGLGVNYQTVVVPRLDNDANIWLVKRINSLVVSPFNDDYSRARTQQSDMFTPVSYLDVIEGICNVYGLMCYDFAGDLIFRKADFSGTYVTIAVSDLAGSLDWTAISSPHGDTVFSISQYLTWADSESTVGLVKPFQRIIREQQGKYIDKASFDFNHLKCYSLVRQSGTNDRYKYAMLQSETPELVGDKLVFNQTIDYNGYMGQYGATPMVYADILATGKLQEKTEMICVNVDASWANYTDLFHIVFMERPTGNDFWLNFDLIWGDRPNYMNSDASATHYNLGVNIKIGNQYYHTDGVWSSSPLSDAGLTFQSVHITNAPNGPVEIIFKLAAKPTNPQRLVGIKNITLEEDELVWSEFTVDNYSEVKIDNTNGDGDGEQTISNLISIYGTNSNALRPSSGIAAPAYPYLLNAQRRMVARYKMTDPNLLYYYPLLAFLQDATGTKWRVIAESFDLWNDEVVLTLHQSNNF